MGDKEEEQNQAEKQEESVKNPVPNHYNSVYDTLMMCVCMIRSIRNLSGRIQLDSRFLIFR